MAKASSLFSALRNAGLAAGVGLASLFITPSAIAAGMVTLTASYNISISGITIGKADVKSRFTPKGYAAAINGSTWGISRFVSDAQAMLAGAGRLAGTRVSPASYSLETKESGFETSVSMAMSGGSITAVDAWPGLMEAADRVPLTNSHKRGVVDPVGAFVVALDRDGPPDGRSVCNRTVKVFDGWQRFDIRLSYKDTRTVSGAYNGDVIVCSARYVPVAGHRPTRDSVEYMANNERLEIWMAPVEGARVMVPYRILIGTQVGDLIIMARAFTAAREDQRASAN